MASPSHAHNHSLVSGVAECSALVSAEQREQRQATHEHVSKCRHACVRLMETERASVTGRHASGFCIDIRFLATSENGKPSGLGEMAAHGKQMDENG